jgi:hypothetical protein
MSPVVAEIVDWAALGEVVVASLAAGIGVTLCFSLGILGATRFADLRRDRRPVGATIYGLLGMLGMTASAAAIVVALIVMTTK